ncbi:class I SAM-dependent methyltransferase [bacterium]|nr:class I SAM-dependent methyltransferase [bacterium]
MGLLKEFLSDTTRAKHRFVDALGDYSLSVETKGRIEPFELDLPEHSLASSRAYQAAPYLILRSIFVALKKIKAPQETFLDIGCGKGRALLMAHRWGYKNLLGLDLSGRMISNASQNLAKKGIFHARLKVADAVNFQYPSGDSVFFLNNPFDGNILRPVVTALKEQSSPESVFVYLNPLREHLFQQLGFKKVYEIDSFNHNYKSSFFRL